MTLEIITRAWSCPWQQPKRSGLIDPFSAKSDVNCLTLRESSPPCPDDEAGRRRHRPQQGQHGARGSVPHVLGNAELAVRLERLGLVVHRLLGRTDVSRVSPSYRAAVGLRVHANGLSVVPLVNEASGPARRVERPDEEVNDDATTVLHRGLFRLVVSEGYKMWYRSRFSRMRISQPLRALCYSLALST